MRTDRVAFGAATAAAALPLALAPLAPGGDTPWHAAVVAVLAAGDDAGDRFLGAVEIDDRLGAYAAVYRLLALLARVVGAPLAVQILLVAYVVAFLWSARRLVRAFGGDGMLALLAVPAAYSTTLEFGFLVYLPTLPLTLWAWALVREVMRGAPGARWVALALAWVAICLCHPFAAAVAALGGALLVGCHLERSAVVLRRAAVLCALAAVGALPALVSLGAAAGEGEPRIPGLAQQPLWSRLGTQVFVAPAESITHAPARLFGFVGGGAWPVLLAAVALAIALTWQRVAPIAQDEPAARRRAPLYLAALLGALYLVTPFTFEWPRNWYAAQPRILPLCWIAALVALRPAEGARWPRLAAQGFAAAALALLLGRSLGPHAAEARDLATVIERSADGVRTLGLVEQPPAVDRVPPSSFRHATAWLVAERGGVASHLAIAEPRGLNTGQHIPVHAAPGAPPLPAAPAPGRPHAFRWDEHAAGWQQFLVRDDDPAHPHAYFAGHEAEVELVARAGRWRLFRRR